MATAIIDQAGKGSRKHRNVSTRSFRSEHERIFGANGRPEEQTQARAKYRSLAAGEVLCEADEFEDSILGWTRTHFPGFKVTSTEGAAGLYRRKVAGFCKGLT